MPNVKVLGQVSVSPQGDWVNTYNYSKLDLVRHQNASFIALQNNTAIEPNVSSNWQQYWMLIVQDGSGGSGSGAVESVNGKIGIVVLDATDVGAVAEMPNGTTPLINENGQIDDTYLPQQSGGVVETVNNIAPDENGNIELTAEDVGAVPEDQYPTGTVAGVVKVNTSNSGLTLATGTAAGQLQVQIASPVAINIRTGYKATNNVNYGERAPISAGNMDLALKYAITGTVNGVVGNQLPLNDEERASVKEWLGIGESGGGTQLYKHEITGSFTADNTQTTYNMPSDSGAEAYIITTSGTPLTSTTATKEILTAISIKLSCITEDQSESGIIYFGLKTSGLYIFQYINANSLSVSNLAIGSFNITNDTVITL